MELYHNLILFSQNENLWCYIDLFNTFQYYVLLSNKWDPIENIHQSYLQMIQKLDRKLPDIYLRKPKHVLAYADFLTYVINKYGVDREKLLIPLTCIDFYFDEDDRLNDLLLKLNEKF